MSKTINTKLIIIGSGPAGLTAAIYAARANLQPIVFAGEAWGGQLMLTTEVENFPGFPEGIMGPELMQNMIKQAERFGAQILYQSVEKVDFSDNANKQFFIYSNEDTYISEAVIIATGSKSKWLNIEDENKLIGKGITTCATCDGAFYKGKIVVVVGGGDTAMEEALFLTNFASKVYLIHRRDKFRASKIMQDRVFAHEKIEVIFDTEIVGLNPDIVEHKFDKLSKVKLYNNISEKHSILDVDGLFIAIGHEPQTILFKGIIDLDAKGYINPVNGSQVKTNINGVYVCGDVSDYRYRQAIVAAGHGCMAELEAEAYIHGFTNDKLLIG